MDALDVAILSRMRFEPGRKPSVRELSESFSLDEKTIRTRMKRAEQELVKGYEVLPHPALVGRKLSTYFLVWEDPAAKAAAIAKLKLIKEVQSIDECMRSAVIHLAHRPDEDPEQVLTLVSELTKTEPVKLYDHKFPPVRSRPSLLDWRIIKAVKRDPMQPLPEVAHDLGVTTRTVKNRLNRLTQTNAVFKLPVMRTDRVTNIFMYMLFFLFEEGRAEEALKGIRRLGRGRLLCHFENSGGGAVLGLCSTRMAEAEEVYQEAQSVPGMSMIFLDFPREKHDQSRLLNSLIEEQITMARDQRTPSSPADA